MLYVFPADTFGVAIDDYARPYENPISVAKGGCRSPVCRRLYEYRLHGMDVVHWIRRARGMDA